MESPNPKRFSPMLTVSVAAMVLLMGAIFFTISNLQQNQDNRSKAAAANLILNPGCEGSTNYFKGYQGVLTIDTTHEHSGASSCQITSTGGTFYDIEATQSVSNATAGMYTGSAWVKAPYSYSTSIGKKVYVAFRVNGTTTYGPAVTLSTTWTQAVNAVNVPAGASVVFYVVQDPGSVGNVFLADDLAFQSGNAPVSTVVPPTVAPTQVPTHAPTAIPTPTKAPTGVPTSVPTPTKAPTGVPTVVPTATKAPTGVPTPTTAVLMTATPFPTALPTATPTPVQPTAIPTATPVPAAGSTLVKATVLMHGIGHGGDSVNPNGLGNANPLHSQRTITMDIYDTQNQLVTSKQGTVLFDPTAGNFSGTINLGTGFASGVYTIKIKSDQYLRGLVGGIQTITSGQTNTLPSLTLIAGDVNGDNQINIVDYNLIVGCYSDLLPAISCTPSSKLLTDLTDDGNVNEFDYNFFIRELTNLGGQ